MVYKYIYFSHTYFETQDYQRIMYLITNPGSVIVYSADIKDIQEIFMLRR